MIVIGASLGGMKVLRTILRALPKTFPQPIAAVLHRHRDPSDLLVQLLQLDSPLPVTEVTDKEPIYPGHLYLAPPDYHLLVEPAGFSLSTDDPVQFARPSIDVLFESAADTFGPAVIGIILTGANHDGAHGAARIQEKGGRVLVQDPGTAESSIMPLATMESTGSLRICSPEEMGPLLLKLVLAPTSPSS